MITEVRCYRSDDSVQLVFYDEMDMADVFTFSEKADIEYILSLVRIQVPCEALMVEARDRSQVTVH